METTRATCLRGLGYQPDVAMEIQEVMDICVVAMKIQVVMAMRTYPDHCFGDLRDCFHVCHVHGVNLESSHMITSSSR